MLMDKLTKVIDQHPDDPEPRWQMGQAAMEGEMYTLAYQCFQAALDLDPGFSPPAMDWRLFVPRRDSITKPP